MKENWKRNENYPNYEISNYGEVRSVKRKRSVEPLYFHTTDEMKIYICDKNCKYTYISLKRLIAETFNRGPHDDCDVVQADGDFYNIHADNLVWVKRIIDILRKELLHDGTRMAKRVRTSIA